MIPECFVIQSNGYKALCNTTEYLVVNIAPMFIIYEWILIKIIVIARQYYSILVQKH